MSSKLHCDICDGIVGSSGGKFEVVPYTNTPEETDLCHAHLTSLLYVLSVWKAFEQGGVASWPERPVSR
jgi:hypothetical protein